MFDPKRPYKMKESWLERAFQRFTLLPFYKMIPIIGIISGSIVAMQYLVIWLFDIPEESRILVTSGGMFLVLVVLLTILFRAVIKLFRDSLLKYVSGPDALRTMTAGGLENLCMALYEAQGYRVKRRAIFRQPDGGVDLEIFKDGKRSLVQCKKWTHESVGVDKVRELLGVVARKEADYGALITTNEFTEATEREALNRIVLIPHAKLWEMVEDARLEEVVSREQKRAFPVESREETKTGLELKRGKRPMCPECGSKLVLKENQTDHGLFLGCAGFKKGCKFTVPVEDGRREDGWTSCIYNMFKRLIYTLCGVNYILAVPTYLRFIPDVTKTPFA